MYITDRTGYSFLQILVFVIYFVSYKYFILAFVLIRNVTDIQIFRFESKRITNQIIIANIFSNPIKGLYVMITANMSSTTV